MVELIASTAKIEDVDLFPRFDVMKRWHDVDHMKFESFVSPDGLHMNDWSYGCFAKASWHGHRRSGAAAGHVGDRRAARVLSGIGASLFTPSPAPSADPRSGRRGARARPRTAQARRQCRARRAAPASTADAWSCRMCDQALGVAEIVGDADELQRIEERNAASLPPLISNEQSVEPAFICFLMMSACGWSLRPAEITRDSLLWLASASATALAFLVRCLTRTGSVSSPLSSTQALNGDSDGWSAAAVGDRSRINFHGRG